MTQLQTAYKATTYDTYQYLNPNGRIFTPRALRS